MSHIDTHFNTNEDNVEKWQKTEMSTWTAYIKLLVLSTILHEFPLNEVKKMLSNNNSREKRETKISTRHYAQTTFGFYSHTVKA